MRRTVALAMVVVALGALSSGARAGLHDYRYNSTTQHIYARTDVLVWTAAEAQAAAAGGHLATINGDAENGWIVSTFGGSRWIGFNDAATEGTWVWSSGTGGTFDYGTWTGTSYHKWYNPQDGAPGGGEPNNSGGEHYTEIRGDTYWNDLRATHTREGVAEFEPEALASGIERITDPVTGRQYAVLGVMTWEEGEELAQLLGGHLPTVRNQHEDDFLLDLSGELGNHVWLGYNDLDVEGTWQWASGVLPGYENWNSGEPNDAGAGEDYALLYSSNGRWNDAGATSQYYAIVEFVPEPGTCVLLGVGLAALARRRRRRAR